MTPWRVARNPVTENARVDELPAFPALLETGAG